MKPDENFFVAICKATINRKWKNISINELWYKITILIMNFLNILDLD